MRQVTCRIPSRGASGVTHGAEVSLSDEKNPAILGVNPNGAVRKPALRHKQTSRNDLPQNERPPQSSRRIRSAASCATYRPHHAPDRRPSARLRRRARRAARAYARLRPCRITPTSSLNEWLSGLKKWIGCSFFADRGGWPMSADDRDVVPKGQELVFDRLQQ